LTIKRFGRAQKAILSRKIQRNEILNTEYLVWDQKKKIIFSDKKVQVTTPNDIIFGEGFESDETI
jgi:hypothetical protein